MKTKLHSLLGLVLVASLLSLLSLAAFGQTAATNATHAPPLPPELTENLPWLQTLMKANEYAMGLPAIPVVILGCIMVGYMLKLLPKFPNEWIPFSVICSGIIANLVVTPLDSGLNIVRAVIFGMACGGLAIWIHQKKLKDLIDVNSLKSGVGLLLLTGLVFGTTACRPTLQVKAGADPIVVRAEWLAENSLSAFDSFFAWEAQHRATLPEKVRQTATRLSDREKADGTVIPGVAHESIGALITAKEEYKAAKTAANGDKVKAATAALLTLANEVRGFQGLPPLVLPALAPSATDLMNQFTNAPPVPSN